jgi:hypothetical protein
MKTYSRKTKFIVGLVGLIFLAVIAGAISISIAKVIYWALS